MCISLIYIYIQTHTCTCTHIYSVESSCSIVSRLCDPMDCSMSGFPSHHQLPTLAQIHVHRVADAIQPFHPLFPLLSHLQSFPASESFLPISWPEYWSFSFSISHSNEYIGLISFKIDWFDFLAVQGTFKYSSKGINSSALSFHCSPTLTSTHDYWKDHSSD